MFPPFVFIKKMTIEVKMKYTREIKTLQLLIRSAQSYSPFR